MENEDNNNNAGDNINDANEQCVFCNINREITKTVEETENFMVVLSNPRLMKGHLLIIPKRHMVTISQMTKEEWDELKPLIETYEKKILDHFGTGCDLIQNYRPFIKGNLFKVAHLHFHLQPRNLYDELYDKSQKHHDDIFVKLTDEETSEVLGLLKE